jgi:tetratricopeptide (TPR) repeat protein
MRLPRNLFFLALALTIVWVCSAQDNQNPIPKNEFEKKDSGTTIKPLETESSEPSTEQGTSPANTQLARLARQAYGMSADQASRLEESLIHDPNDLTARAQLLGYYFAASPRLNPETAHEARVRHILWLVQNQPESELAGMSEATIDPVGDSLADPAGYEKVKALWLEQVKSHPDKVMVLVNAAWFFKLPDKAIAADLLTRAHAIDPGNQNASAGLGIVYAAAILGLTGMNQNRFPTETKPEEAGSPFAQKARKELNKSQDAQVIGTAGYYLNFWGSILSAQGKTLTDYEDLAEKCLTKAQTLDPGNPEWARDLASLYKLRAIKAKSREARAAEMSLPQDVTWTDPGTGLMWTKEDNGSKINWNEANQYCRDMKVKDYSDWRLPTIEELSGIFDKTPNVGGYHIKGGIHLSLCCEWSSSTGLDSNQKWLLHFMGGGRVSGRLDYTFPVLCVRNAAK